MSLIRVYQDDGRCLAACVATILGADLDDVSPPGDACPWEPVSRFLAGRGLGLAWWPVDSGEIAYEPDTDPVEPLSVAEIDGTESRHAVVIDRKGRCLHDPGGEGVVKPGSTARVHAVIGIVAGPSDPCPYCPPGQRPDHAVR